MDCCCRLAMDELGLSIFDKLWFSLPMEPKLSTIMDELIKDDLDMDICFVSSLMAMVIPGWNRLVMLP